MKVVGIILKIVAALAAVAGIVYVVATYGDKIVAWAKKMLGICDCDCQCDCEDDCENCNCEDSCDACSCECSCQCEEAEDAEEAEAEEAPAEEAEADPNEADETDFQA